MRAPTHTTTWQNEQIAVLALPSRLWHWNSPGVPCLKDVLKERREEGCGERQIREINSILIQAARARCACVFVQLCLHAHTLYMYVGIRICPPTREPQALYSHFFLRDRLFSLILWSQTMTVIELKMELKSHMLKKPFGHFFLHKDT